MSLASNDETPFLAPWWLSPAVAYWSGQPGIAGSSHEALNGIVDSARFFLAEDPSQARQIIQNRGVDWIFAYDWDRLGRSCVDLLGQPPPNHPIGRVLDRTAALTPA